MNLQFTNKGGNFVSEFEVTSDFNLHIEGVRLSDMHIYQKTAGGSYAKVTDFPSERSQDRVADFDFASLVYPKFIKVVCVTEPTNAELVTDGEVTEIKSQSKEVEIVANGVTEIAPDNGFGYLSGVKVNVNVPQSGEEESSIEYLDVSEIMLNPTNPNIVGVLGGAQAIKINYYGMQITAPVYFVLSMLNDVQAVVTNTKQMSIDWYAKIIIDGESKTLLEFLLMKLTKEELDAIPRITKEEFYAL